MLNIRNVSVKVIEKQLLRNINLKIEENSFWVLLGGNGAGKSTLLKTIAGNLPYAQGSIEIKNKRLQNWTIETLSQTRAVLSQNITLVFPMKVLEVVLLGRYPYCQGRAASEKDMSIAYKALELMGVAHYADIDINRLSGGEQQRVHLARVLSQIWESSAEQPKLLLLDEPTSNLDIIYQHVLLEHLQRNIKENALTVLAILHDMNLAARYASHIALLHQGELLTAGITQHVLTPHWIKLAFGVSSVVQTHPVFDCIQISTY